MSRTTRSSRADRARRAAARIAGLALAAALAGPVAATPEAPPLPAAVAAQVPALRPQGGGELTFLGLSIYDGWYWAEDRAWTTDRPHVLDLHYHRRLAGAAIAARSIGEIEKLGRGSADQRARWEEAMRRIFPDVAVGDRLTGLFLPPGLVRYFHNGRPIGEIDDPLFARAFFGIWLDPKTSRADFRRRLLGG